jgi:pseudouridylate synthase
VAYERVCLGEFKDTRAYKILLLSGYKMEVAQRLIDKGRLICNDKILTKNDVVNGKCFLIDYVPNPCGLKPIFDTKQFAVFDKPSGVLSHPNGRHCKYSLSDEIYTLFGRDAAVAHRLDYETSGLIVVGKNKSTVVKLKRLFETRAVVKSYLALVRGDVRNLAVRVGEFSGEVEIIRDCDDKKNFISSTIGHNIENFKDYTKFGTKFFDTSKLCEFKPSQVSKNCYGGNFCFNIYAAMNLAHNYDDVKMRMKICESGKMAVTRVKLVEYFADINASLVRCFPLTGRQHQIRLHLFHVQHPIIGEPLYGLSREHIIKILDGKISKNERFLLTGATRLLLHADEIYFTLDEKFYRIKSKFDATREFYKLVQ